MNGWDDFVSFIRALSYLLIIGTFAEKHYFIFIIICTYEHIYLHITILINVLFLLAHRYYIETEKGELVRSFIHKHTHVHKCTLFIFLCILHLYTYVYLHTYVYILHFAFTHLCIYLYIYLSLSIYI